MMDGKPLANASISFVSDDDSESIPAFGQTDENGYYELAQDAIKIGANAASYKVRIWTGVEAKTDVDPPIPAVPERVPMRYNTQTELVATVVPGEDNVFNFDLQSTGPIFRFESSER